MDDAKLFAYRDAGAAIGWLEAIGFEVVSREDAEDGSVRHCEVRLGGAVVMLSSYDADYEVPPLEGNSTGQGLYLLVGDVPAIHEAAVAAGGTSVFAPEQTEWGSTRSRVLDPEGLEWSFGTYEPGKSW
jgi:uncharacterized glyoxalase superfamily protein PhnB